MDEPRAMGPGSRGKSRGVPATAEPQRAQAVRRLSRLLGKVLEPAARARGFAEANLIPEWALIVGPERAARCQPIRLRFLRGRASGATLELRASGGAALEVQHAAPQLVERINRYFGWPVVARLQLVQGPLPPIPRPPAERRRRSLTQDERAALEERVASIAEDELRGALLALGTSIHSRSVPRRGG